VVVTTSTWVAPPPALASLPPVRRSVLSPPAVLVVSGVAPPTRSSAIKRLADRSLCCAGLQWLLGGSIEGSSGSSSYDDSDSIGCLGPEFFTLRALLSSTRPVLSTINKGIGGQQLCQGMWAVYGIGRAIAAAA
jgi:hypothetical protein